jgi:hypothetical protein
MILEIRMTKDLITQACMNAYKRGDFRALRPFFKDGKGYIEHGTGTGAFLTCDREVPVECARVTKEEWHEMDNVANVARSQLHRTFRLQQEGFIGARPDGYNGEDPLFIHLDFSTPVFVRDAMRYVCGKVEHIVDDLFILHKDGHIHSGVPVIYMIMWPTVLQKSPLYNEPSTWDDGLLLSVVSAFYLPGIDRDTVIDLGRTPPSYYDKIRF